MNLNGAIIDKETQSKIEAIEKDFRVEVTLTEDGPIVKSLDGNKRLEEEAKDLVKANLYSFLLDQLMGSGAQVIFTHNGEFYDSDL